MSNVNRNIKCKFCYDILNIPRQRQQIRTGAKFGTRDSWKTRDGVAVQGNKRVEYTRGGGHLFRRQSFSVLSHIGDAVIDKTAMHQTCTLQTCRCMWDLKSIFPPTDVDEYTCMRQNLKALFRKKSHETHLCTLRL